MNELMDAIRCTIMDIYKSRTWRNTKKDIEEFTKLLVPMTRDIIETRIL